MASAAKSSNGCMPSSLPLSPSNAHPFSLWHCQCCLSCSLCSRITAAAATAVAAAAAAAQLSGWSLIIMYIGSAVAKVT